MSASNLTRDLICPTYLEGLVDCTRLCSLQVPHPLVVRKGKKPPPCGRDCNATLNLAKLAKELVSSVTSNPKYLSIVPWSCSNCLKINIGVTRCSKCPHDPIMDNPFYNRVAKHFEFFFKSLVAHVSTNPPTNFSPQKVTNFTLIRTILSSHGQYWQALAPPNKKLPRHCNCTLPPTTPPPQITEKYSIEDDDDDMTLLLNASSESLYEVYPHFSQSLATLTCIF